MDEGVKLDPGGLKNACERNLSSKPQEAKWKRRKMFISTSLFHKNLQLIELWTPTRFFKCMLWRNML